MLIPMERRIHLGDNSKGFPLTTEIDDFLTLEEGEIRIDACEMSADMRLALDELMLGDLQKELGPYLEPRQIDALLARRDRILQACSADRLSR